MSYADQLQEIAAQYRAEMRECDKNRKAMWFAFVENIRKAEEKKYEVSARS